jgi:hypothetical protein
MKGRQTVILHLDKALDSSEYKALYFNLRRQVWNGCLLLPPDVQFLGVSDSDADVVLIQKGEEDERDID